MVLCPTWIPCLLGFAHLQAQFLVDPGLVSVPGLEVGYPLSKMYCTEIPGFHCCLALDGEYGEDHLGKAMPNRAIIHL